MGKTALLLVIVGGGDATNDFGAGLLQSLTEAMQPHVVIQVVEVEPGELEFKDVRRVLVERKRQTIGLHRLDGARNLLRFRASDRPLERGRAAGFAIATLFPEWRRVEESSPPLPAPPPVPPPPAPDVVAAPAPEAAGADHATAAPSAPAAPAARPEPAAPPEPNPFPDGESGAGKQVAAPQLAVSESTAPRRSSLGELGFELRAGWLWAVATAGAGGSAAVLVRLSPRCWTRLSAFAGTGELAAASAQGLWLRPAGGVACEIGFGRVGVGGGADLGASGLYLFRDGQTQGRWFGSAHASLSISVKLGPVQAVLVPGVEVPFGDTRVTVNAQERSYFPPFEFTLEAGVRFLPDSAPLESR